MCELNLPWKFCELLFRGAEKEQTVAHYGTAGAPAKPWRAGAVHWWVPALATVAVLVEYGLPFHTTQIEVVVFTAWTVAFGAIGLRVLRMTDAEWDGVATPRRADAPVSA